MFPCDDHEKWHKPLRNASKLCHFCKVDKTNVLVSWINVFKTKTFLVKSNVQWSKGGSIFGIKHNLKHKYFKRLQVLLSFLCFFLLYA